MDGSAYTIHKFVSYDLRRCPGYPMFLGSGDFASLDCSDGRTGQRLRECTAHLKQIKLNNHCLSTGEKKRTWTTNRKSCLRQRLQASSLGRRRTKTVCKPVKSVLNGLSRTVKNRVLNRSSYLVLDTLIDKIKC